MTRSRFVASMGAALALAGAACNRGPAQSKPETAQPPPAGIRYEANISAGGIAPPAAELNSPKELTHEAATAGAGLFASMNCDGCHGGGAPGWVGPSLIDGRWRYGGAGEEIFSSIYYGRPKGMPAYGGVLGTAGVWMLVAYLKSLPAPNVVPTTSYEEMDRAVPASAPAPETGPTAASASDTAMTPEQMLTRYGCVACHAVDGKVVGPSMNAVAAKYKGHPEVENSLVEKVRNGGTGVWGSIPMTPNPQVPDQDLHTLIKWVLGRR